MNRDQAAYCLAAMIDGEGTVQFLLVDGVGLRSRSEAAVLRQDRARVGLAHLHRKK